MELKHTRNVLKQKQSELQTNDTMYLKDKKLYDQIDGEIKKITVSILLIFIEYFKIVMFFFGKFITITFAYFFLEFIYRMKCPK